MSFQREGSDLRSEYAKLNWGSKWPVVKSSDNEGKNNFYAIVLCNYLF